MANKLFFALLFICCAQFAQAQLSNFVVFSEKSDPFTLVLNGQQINQQPALNVKVTNLQSAQYALRVIFNNPSLPAFEEVIFINPANEVTYALQRDQLGNSQMRFVNEFSLIYRPIPPANQQTVAYTGPVGLPTTNVTPPPTPPVPAGTLDVAINTGTPPTTVSDPVVVSMDPPPVIEPTSTTVAPPIVVEEPVITEPGRPDPLPGYTGPIGCDWPLDADGFATAKASIASKSFSDSKMRVAKQVARSNCLLTTQIKEIMAGFSFETDKLEFAKFAYDFTYDKGNYYKVNDAFSFENTISELETYLQGR